MSIAGYKLSQIRKTVVAVIGVVVIIANSFLAEFANYLSEDVASWVTAGVGLVTAVSVFLVKNAPVIDAIDGTPAH